MPPEGFLIRPDAADPRWGLVTLVAANAAVVMAVLLGWLDLREVLLTFWAETGVIGGWALWRMLRLGGLVMIPLLLFYTLHFSGFMFVHLVFLGLLTQPDFTRAIWDDGSFTASDRAAGDSNSFGPTIQAALRDVPLWAVVLLIIAHGVESERMLRRHRAMRDEAAAATEAKDGVFKKLERMPVGGMYGRVIVMHVTLIAGAFVAAWLGTPVWLVAVLVVLKTLVDVGGFAGRKTAAVKSD